MVRKAENKAAMQAESSTHSRNSDRVCSSAIPCRIKAVDRRRTTGAKV